MSGRKSFEDYGRRRVSSMHKQPYSKRSSLDEVQSRVSKQPEPYSAHPAVEESHFKSFHSGLEKTTSDLAASN
jgi:serine/threonine protein kinase